MKGFVVGAKDHSGNTITKIFSSSDEYAIYEIKTNVLSDSIRVQIDTIIEDDLTIPKRFDAVRVNFAKLKGLLYKANDDTSLKTRIAHIISHALRGNPEEANKQFEELILEINAFYSKQFNHRLRYLITILLLTLIQIAFSITLCIYDFFCQCSEIRTLVFVVTAGSIGGFLSISRRLRNTVFEKDVRPSLYVIYGIERVFISIFGAVVIYFAIRSNIVFGMVKDLPEPVTGYIVFSILAGFSETFIPNLLIKLEADKK